MTEFWITAGLSGLVAIVTSAVVSIWGVARDIKHKSVIEERQKWRDSLRELVPDLLSQEDRPSREKIRDSIVLRLNPYKDWDAVRLLDRYVAEPSRGNGEYIVQFFQDMLKRDWEKAKFEAGLNPWFAAARSNRLVDKQRQSAMDGNETH